MASRAALATTSSSSSSHHLLSRVFRRRLAGAADHHGPERVNLWEDPMNPGRWKEEHFVLASLAGWGLIIYGGYKAFGGGKKETKTEAAPAAAQSQ